MIGATIAGFFHYIKVGPLDADAEDEHAATPPAGPDGGRDGSAEKHNADIV
ncbi:Formate dehydrogenase N, transmembrane [compost metagenome]